MGFVPVVLPLTQIIAVPVANLPDADLYDGLIVTSPNAVRHAPDEIFRRFASMPVYAVGDATGAAASRAGCKDVRIAAGTAADLSELIGREEGAGARLLHLAGVQRTAGFIDALEAQNIRADIVEVYSADEISYSTDFLSGVFGTGSLWAALVLSERAGQLLGAIVGFNEPFENTTYFVISEKVARAVEPFAGGRIVVSKMPSEDGVLALLSSDR
jgi:uroporphyrinogen-III synthase